MNAEELRETVTELLYILNTKEENDDGTLFYPTIISSCRALDAQRVADILSKLEKELL